MNKCINDFYSHIEIDTDAIHTIIETAKTVKPQKENNRWIIIALTCVITLVIGGASVFFLTQSAMNINETPDFSYENISRFNTLGMGDQLLMKHDGFVLRISGAYFNGEKMYLALEGEFDSDMKEINKEADTLTIRPHTENSIHFSVNGEKKEIAEKEIKLEKRGKIFGATVSADVSIEDSITLVKLSVPSIAAYKKGQYITTLNGPFVMEEMVNRVYTTDEENLINHGDEIFISYIAAIPKGAIEEGIGLSLHCFIPDRLIDQEKPVKAVIYNEDGSCVDPIQVFQKKKDNGTEISADFGYPKTRRVRVELINEKGHIVQEYEVYLNDLNKRFAVDQ